MQKQYESDESNESEWVKFGSYELIYIISQLFLESDSFKSARCWNMHVPSHLKQGLMQIQYACTVWFPLMEWNIFVDEHIQLSFMNSSIACSRRGNTMTDEE